MTPSSNGRAIPLLLGQTIHREHIKGNLAFDFSGTILTIHQPLDIAILRQAVRMVIRKHQALRLSFRAGEEGTWAAYVRDDLAEAPLDEACRRIAMTEGRLEERLEAVTAEAQRIASNIDPFSGCPLLRVVLFDLGDTRRLLLAIHHFACDGLSAQTVWADIAHFYGEASRGHVEPPALRDELVELAAFLRELAQGSRPTTLDYWLRERTLTPVPGCNVGRPFVCSWSESTTRRTTMSRASLLRFKERAAKEYGCFVPELLLGAYLYVIGEWLGDGWVSVGNWTSARIVGRGRFPVDGIIGNLAFPVFTYFELDRRRDLAATVKYARSQQLDALEHALDFGACRFLEHGPERELSASVKTIKALPMPLFTFNFMGAVPDRRAGVAYETADERLSGYVGGESEKYSLLDFDIDTEGGQLFLETNHPVHHVASGQLSAVAERLGRLLGRLAS